MLLSRDEIRKDKAVDAMTDAILQRDQPRTADLFFTRRVPTSCLVRCSNRSPLRATQPGEPRRGCCATKDEAIMAFDFARATAVANTYLGSGADRDPLLASLAVTACKFQDDPHNQKISHSTFEEYRHNSTHLRDRLLLATARLLAGWPKMPGERDCYGRFMKEWIRN
jgi:hypothetical protein